MYARGLYYRRYSYGTCRLVYERSLQYAWARHWGNVPLPCTEVEMIGMFTTVTDDPEEEYPVIWGQL
jgi:hypothetical protein